MESSKAIDQVLEELRELHMFMEEVNQSLLDVEAVVGSVRRVGESQSTGGSTAVVGSVSSSFSLESVSLRDKEGNGGSSTMLKLSADVEYRLLQKLRWKAESLRNVLKDTGQRMKDKYFGLRQLVSRSDSMLEKFSNAGIGRDASFDAIKDKDMVAIEKYLLVRKEAVAVLVKCDEKMKN